MRNPFALPILCIFALLSVCGAHGQTVEEPRPPQPGDSVGDFGFWQGEWLVQNIRYDRESDSYIDAGSGRSSAEMLLDGTVLLERWEGVEGAVESSYGVALRYFEPSRDRWVTVRNWPAGSPLTAQFNRVEGTFDEGLMALHPARVFAGNFEIEQFLSTRTVVGDVSGNGFRVQLQRPVNGQFWAASWAMDYAREGSATAEAGPMRIEPVPESVASHAEEPRFVDWMIGQWASVNGAGGVDLRVSSMLRGLGFIVAIEIDRGGIEASALLIGAWDDKTGSWQLREVGMNRPLRSLAWETVGRLRPGGMVLRSKGTDDLGGMVFRRLDGDGMQFELTLPDGERLDVELTKQ